MGSSCSIERKHSHNKKKSMNQSDPSTLKDNKNFTNNPILDPLNPKQKQKVLKLDNNDKNAFHFQIFHSNLSQKSLQDIPVNSFLEEKPQETSQWKDWKFILQDSVFLNVFYKDYQAKTLGTMDDYQIKKDLNRTFPIESFFRLLNSDSICEGQEKLYKVLKAITLHFSYIGYCQGMNFLAGFLLLMNGGNENDAFSFFVKLSIDSNFFLVHLYEEKFPLLSFLIFVFNRIAKKKIPEIFKFLKKLDFPEEAWLYKWYLSFFLNGFPMNQAVKFWNFFLKKNLFSFISLTISLLKNLKKNYLNKDRSDFMELINKLNEYEIMNVEKCIKDAEKIKISKRTIGKLAEEFVILNPKFNKNFCLLYFMSYNKKKNQIKRIKAKENVK